MIARRVIPFVLICLIAWAGGCSPYVEGFHYAPHPAVVEIRGAAAPGPAATQPYQEGQQSPLTAYATIIGVRRADDDRHLPESIEVRLRLDNHGPQDVEFDPRTLELTDAELVRFPPPILGAPQPASLAPGQPFVLQANFPFPPGQSYDSRGMQTLQLHWGLRIDGQVVPQTAAFHLVHRYYDYGPYWGWGYAPYPAFCPPAVGVGATIIVR